MHVSASVSGTQNTLTLWVDGKRQTNGAGKLEVDVALAIGTHILSVTGLDASGGNVQQTVQVSVPAPRYALVMNDDHTISSYLFDVSNSQLRPQDFTALGSTPQSLAVAAGTAMIRRPSDSLVAYLVGSQTTGTLSGPFSVKENSWSPKLSVSALSSPALRRQAR